MEHWSKRLWRALSWKGWSQRELARRAEIDEQKVFKYLQGKVDQPRGDSDFRYRWGNKLVARLGY